MLHGCVLYDLHSLSMEHNVRDEPRMFEREKVSAALSRIKKDFPIADGHLELITEDRSDDVIDIMANHFFKNEPLAYAFDVEMNPFIEKRIRQRLTENLCIMALSNETNEIMGVGLCRVARECDVLDLNDVDDANTRAMFAFLTQKASEIILYKDGLSEIFHVVNLAVHQKFRHRGLASVIFGASIALAKELGFKAFKVEGTSSYSQRIFEKFGLELILELPYNEYKYKDAYISERTGVHTSTRCYLLLF